MYPEDPGPPPGSILLDPSGYISDRTNDTTAGCFTKGGKRIQVTFWVAHPPRASYFVVHSPGLEIGDKPTLRLIAMPPYLSFSDCNVGLLRFRGRGMFFIAVLALFACLIIRIF